MSMDDAYKQVAISADAGVMFAEAVVKLGEAAKALGVEVRSIKFKTDRQRDHAEDSLRAALGVGNPYAERHVRTTPGRGEQIDGISFEFHKRDLR